MVGAVRNDCTFFVCDVALALRKLVERCLECRFLFEKLFFLFSDFCADLVHFGTKWDYMRFIG